MKEFKNNLVSRDGKVFSNKGKEKGFDVGNGYKRVGIDNRTYYIHRLVYCVFNDIDINGDFVIMHKNDNKTDNRLDNLMIGSQKENMHDAIKKGRFNRKFTMDIVTEIKDMASYGCTQSEIAKKYNVNQGIISKILNNKSYL